MQTNTKKITVLIIVLAIVAVAVIVANQAYKPKIESVDNRQSSQQKEEAVKPVVTQVDTAKLPDSFPSDIPLEQGAKVQENYNASVAGQTQATRTFVSKKTLAENYTLYKTWLAKNSWKLDASLDQTALKALAGSKGSSTINITISQNQQTSENTVNISFTTKAE